MLGSQKNVRGILHSDNIMSRRVKHQQRLAQVCEAIVDTLLCDVIEEFALDAEWPTGKSDFNLPMLADLVDVLLEQAGDVRRIAGCSNADDRACVRDSMRRSEYGGTAQAMADQDCRRAIGFSQIVGGANKIVEVGRKVSIGELPLAHPETGEIETQHANAAHCQPFGNALGREVIFAAREAV